MDEEPLWLSLKTTAESSILPVFLSGEERPHDENDFHSNKASIEINMMTLATQLKLQSPMNLESCPSNVRHSVVSVILLCGEHASENNWVTPASVKLSQEVLKALCEIYSCERTDEFFRNKFILKQCLHILQPKLTRDSWKRHPAAVACFKWIILQVKMPQIGEHMGIIFSIVLTIADDFELENEILGVTLLEHVINNVTRVDLRNQQHEDVAYDILHRLIYSRDAILVVPVVSCLSTLIAKMDSKFTQHLEFSRLDRSMSVFLGQMEMEQILALRLAYAESLPLVLAAGGVALVRWSRRLQRIMADYLLMEDGSGGVTQLHILKAMLIYMHHTWPRLNTHASQMLSSLLKLLRDLNQSQPTVLPTPEVKVQLLDLLQQCLSTLVQAAPEKCRELLQGVESLEFGNDFHAILSKTMFSNEKTEIPHDVVKGLDYEDISNPPSKLPDEIFES